MLKLKKLKFENLIKFRDNVLRSSLMSERF